MDRIVELSFEKLRRAAASIAAGVEPLCAFAEVGLAKRRRIVAVAVSLSLHFILVALLLVGMESKISGGGSGGVSSGSETGDGFGVELVSIRQAVPNALTVKQADATETVEQSDVTVPQPAAVTIQAVALEMPDMPMVNQATDAATAASNATAATANTQADAGGIGQGGQSSGVDDALWKQIEPCWRRLAGPGTRGAMLRINFSPLGNVAQTADVSNASGSDVNSTAAANQALAECGPYVSAGSREGVVIAFPEIR